MKKCELCNSPAKIYCESDQASLCWNCDSRVHAANFLVAKHLRTLLCNLCQSATPWTASGPKLAPTASVCSSCVTNSTCREEIRNDHRTDSDDDEDRNDRDGDSDDSDDDQTGGGGDNDDEENQVVPWSSTASPPASSSSNSDQDSNCLVCNNSTDISSLGKIAFGFKTPPSDSQIHVDFWGCESISKPLKKNQRKGLGRRAAGGVVNNNFELM